MTFSILHQIILNYSTYGRWTCILFRIKINSPFKRNELVIKGGSGDCPESLVLTSISQIVLWRNGFTLVVSRASQMGNNVLLLKENYRI